MRHVSAPKWMEQELFSWWLYTECTTTTVMNSRLSSSQAEMGLTFRQSLRNTELPCLLCGYSVSSVIPGMFGLARFLALCCFGDIDRCLSLHNSDSMDALLAVRPSMLLTTTISASEEL